MTDKWEPNTPDTKMEFEQATQGEKQQNQECSPVSKLELDALNNEREKPVAEPTLTIGGYIEEAVHTETAMVREERAQYINNRLNHMKKRAHDDFENER